MANKKISFYKEERSYQSFTSILTLAACECCLLFLLLVDAVISYAVTKFACYCKLQTPCILCSRLDHILGHGKFDGYQSLLCRNHMIEISSSVSCQIHHKLIDVNEMCEDCFPSYAIKGRSKSEFEGNTVGKLKLDFDERGLESSFLNRIPNYIVMRPCSCCGKPWRSSKRSHPIAKPNIPLPHLPGRSSVNHHDSLKKIRDKYSNSKSSNHCGKYLRDPFFHVGYTKLKITSESEISFSDEDDENSVIHKRNELEKNSSVQCTSQIRYAAMPSLLDSRVESCMPPDFWKSDDEEVFTSDPSGTHGLTEFDWDKVNHKVNLPALPELILLDDISSLSNTIEKSRLKFPPAQDSDFSELSELMILDDAPPSAGTSPVKSEETGPFDTGNADINKHEDALGFIDITAGRCSEIDQVVNEIHAINTQSDDNHDLSKSCSIDREGEQPSSAAEQSTMNKSDIIMVDLKTLSLENSLAEDSSSKKSFPSISDCDNELLMIDASRFNEIQVIKMPASEECDLESLDESNVSEIEGESIVGRLRRQIEHDKKCINALHKELEEERNASEVAVNQAMAMIMRLQEEKASLNLEALQYLRMMEEQVEYDVDALEKANDLLAEKEKEIQDLEAEIEFYRLNPLDNKVAEDTHIKSCDVEEKFAEGDKIDGITRNKSTTNGISDGSNKLLVAASSNLDFEDEKMYIKHCLMSIERKLKQMSFGEVSSSMPNGLHNENRVYASKNEREFLNFDNIKFHEMTEHDNLPTKRNRQSHNADEESCASVRDDSIDEEEDLKSIEETNSSHQKELDLVFLENEISDLNDTLDALEGDRNFLEHSLNTLGKGNEGLQFIQDIVYQLKELLKLGMKMRYQSGP